MADDKDNEIKSELSDLYRDFSGGWDKYLQEAREDLEMHLGAHFTKAQYDAAQQTGRSLYPFNKTARQVDLIHGYEIRNRHILKIGSVERSDDVAASAHGNHNAADGLCGRLRHSIRGVQVGQPDYRQQLDGDLL